VSWRQVRYAAGGMGMGDFKYIAQRNAMGWRCLRVERIVSMGSMLRTGAILACALFLIALAGQLAEIPFVSPAAAQPADEEPEVDATPTVAQRRTLAARLKERLKTLRQEVKIGQGEVRRALGRWLLEGGEPGKAVQIIFAPPPVTGRSSSAARRIVSSTADNIYKLVIRDYAAIVDPDKDLPEPRPWNPWPEAAAEQKDYAECVLRRVDFYFESKLDQIDEEIELLGSKVPRSGKDIKEAVSLVLALKGEGGIGGFIKNQPLDKAEPPFKKSEWRTKCPTSKYEEEARDEAVKTLPLSVAWNAKCLQSDQFRPDGTVKPYHPTAAALMYDNGSTGLSTYCSGTLIGPNAVLTAAHCVCETTAKDPSGQFFQTAGACAAGAYRRNGQAVSTLDPSNHSVFLQHVGHFNVDRVVVHPKFRWGKLPSADLAILFLKEPVPGIAPMPLNTVRKLPPNTPAAAVGYGAHNPIDASGSITTTATVLESTGLKLQANTVTGRCGGYAQSKKLICWKYRDNQAGMSLGSTCRGDSGGPLYAASGDKTLLVGVTSAGGPSCQPNTEAYDTEVFAFKDWIYSQLQSYPAPVASAVSATGGGDDMKQLLCHFCSTCVEMEGTIVIPPKARRLHVSLNCTPDEIKKGNKLMLDVSNASFTGATGDAGKVCSMENESTTAASCRMNVDAGQVMNIKVGTGLLQQCQIVATSYEWPLK
jgi:hypothetical protein